MGGRCRYQGLCKTHYQNLIESLAYSLKRAPQLIVAQGSILSPLSGQIDRLEGIKWSLRAV